MPRERLNQRGGFISQHPDLDVKVDTIDALQGSERSIVIICFTRSGGEIGFLADDNRLNVACTRAKHLLYMIGDFSTLHRSRFLRSIYDHVLECSAGSVLRFHIPPPHLVDNFQWRWVQDNVDDLA